jgi:SAM-dependent methyltransferase
MATDNFRLTEDAAKKYEAHSVPAMFRPLAQATIAKVTLPPDSRIIDIACGTGALTREISAALAGHGVVAGVDLNQTMIDIAKEKQPEGPHQMIWQAADVCALPFADSSFDLAFIQQGLQFFPDKPSALAEVRRVLIPKGGLYLTCWRAISPFNGALAEALNTHVGPEAAAKARAPFSFRDGDLISRLLTDAGFAIETLQAVVLKRRFSDLGAQILALPVESDLRAAGEAATDRVIAEVADALASYEHDGILVVPQEAHLFFATVA